MTKYLIQRILKALISVIIVVGVVMVMIYSFLNKQSIFATDPVFTKQKSNAKEVYMMQQWELFGYLDYVPFSEYLLDEQRQGNLAAEDYSAAAKLGNKEDGSADSEITAEYAAKFVEKYEKEGYEIVRLKGDMQGRSKKYKDGGEPRLFAYKDVPVLTRLWRYITGLVTVDNIHYVKEDIGER